MEKKTTLLLFGIVVFIFFSAHAFAYGHGKNRHKGNFFGHAREVMDALQLTYAQKENLHSICEISMERVAANRKQFEELQSELSEKVLAGSGSSELEYSEDINQIVDLRAQMVKNRLERWIKFVEILDSDQKKILSGRLKELRKKRPGQRMHLKKYFPFP